MRLRKVKNALDKIKEMNKCILEPTLSKGKWKAIFKNDHPIYLEIGTGKGSFLIENAQKNPDINYLGIEKFESVLIRAVEKPEVQELGNLFFILGDAEELLAMFDENEIDRIYLNFSDPWPKNRHEKRRLTHPFYLNKYRVILKKDSSIEFKTDNRKLFEYSIKTFNDYQCIIKNIHLDLHEDIEVENIRTEYEEKFSKKGPIYKIEVLFYDKK